MKAEQLQFLTVAGLLSAGIGLTGWSTVHWLLYLVPGLLVFAGLTGICPGLIFYRKLGFK